MSNITTRDQPGDSQLQHPSNALPTPPESEHSSDNEKAELEGEDTLRAVSLPLPPPTKVPTEVLEIDKKTPDGWLPRDPRLIRLTGVHPFNVEAPLSDLYNEGFLTSPELFYVRNHGHVPRVEDQDVLDWEFTVEGLVHRPLRLTLRDLMTEYKQRTRPITLVCAGNRRKEQNVVRKTKGFSWGAAGVSTALFTGVDMADVIQRAKPKRGARYVCMEGADKLPNGYYGTSVKLNWAMDPNRGMMLAHGMNGEPLRPDHGKPLRCVIPGQIGGRSVKWLTRLIVTAEPSDNWYHIYDNRVLPTMVSPEESASDEGKKWWMDERYAIYDLSTNSAIAFPAHDETLDLDTQSPESTYNVRGYAYGGGGRRVTRCEISLNKGKSWQLTNIDYAEDRYRDAADRTLLGGKLDSERRESSFCWCFWNLDVKTAELAKADDILVRAMDESMNLQPRDMYWSVLGMMNNPWYRIACMRVGTQIRFEHPTQPALQPGGWMERVKKAGGDLLNGRWGEVDASNDAAPQAPAEEPQEIVMTREGVKTVVTIDELREHDKEDSPWFVVRGEVYDGTKFLEGHPGGAQSILSAAATDCSDEFMAIHSETAKVMMKDYHIGTLNQAGRMALAGGEDPERDSGTARETFLDPRNWRKAFLYSKQTVSWDTRIFTFRLEHENQDFGLPVGQHVMLRLRDPVTREVIIRSYTPMSQPAKKGFVDILVKLYFAKEDYAGGKMSKALDELPVGHFIDVKGPIGKFTYCGNGKCMVNSTERMVKNFVMICGGSGITPIFQVLRGVMQDDKDETKCVVLDGNRKLEDILCKAELEDLARDKEKRCKLLHTLTEGPENWTGLRGRISAPLLKEHADRSMFAAGGVMCLVCGPPAMEKSVHQALTANGWSEDELLFF